MPGFCQFFHDFQTKFPGRSNDLPHVPINDSAEQKTRGYWESGNGQLLSLIGPRWPPRILRPHCDPRDRSFTASSGAAGAEVAQIWRTFKKDLSGPYRPELHYMCGPGPKWREKHDLTDGARRTSGFCRSASLP